MSLSPVAPGSSSAATSPSLSSSYAPATSPRRLISSSSSSSLSQPATSGNSSSILQGRVAQIFNSAVLGEFEEQRQQVIFNFSVRGVPLRGVTAILSLDFPTERAAEDYFHKLTDQGLALGARVAEKEDWKEEEAIGRGARTSESSSKKERVLPPSYKREEDLIMGDSVCVVESWAAKDTAPSVLKGVYVERPFERKEDGRIFRQYLFALE